MRRRCTTTRGLLAAVVWASCAGHDAALAKTFRYSGVLETRLHLRLEERVDLSGSGDFELRTGQFVSYDGGVNRQEIQGYEVVCDPRPDRSRSETDKFGNPFTYLGWKSPGRQVKCVVQFDAYLVTDLTSLAGGADAPIAPRRADPDPPLYLRDSKMLAQEDASVRELAAQLAKGARGQFDAVARVMNHVIDHVEYQVNPPSYSALHALTTGRGNCQNYAHLAAALLHQLGIEARVAYGISLSGPWRAPGPGGGTITMDNAQGRHAWVEARLPDVGWVSFDPQSSQFFVSTHLVRQAVGADSPQVSDSYRAQGGIRIDEKVSVQYVAESNTLAWAGEGPAPNEIVLAGLVSRGEAGTAAPVPPPSRPKPLLVVDPRRRPEPPERPVVPPAPPVVAPPSPPPPPPLPMPSIPPRPLPRPEPAPVPPPPAPPVTPVEPKPTPPKPEPPVFDELAEIGLLDLSEDAYEYVTSKEVHAQRFELRKPLLLWDAELALQKFGGEGGALWVEIIEDVGGLPGPKTRLTSSRVPLAELKLQADYAWVPFSFRALGERAVLEPGRYWLALRYTDDAIVNWHCRIGNPYLDPDDTRSRPARGGPWNNLLHLDFNFLLTGLE